MDENVSKKLKKANAVKDEVVFKMEYKGKVIHESTVETPGYAKDIIEDEDVSFYYFFKDVANKFEDLVNEIHKKKILKKIDKNGSKESK